MLPALSHHIPAKPEGHRCAFWHCICWPVSFFKGSHAHVHANRASHDKFMEASTKYQQSACPNIATSISLLSRTFNTVWYNCTRPTNVYCKDCANISCGVIGRHNGWPALLVHLAVLQEHMASCMSGKVQERDDPRVSSHSNAACPSGWYCFDDERVDPWDISNLAKDCFGGKYQLPDLGQGLLKPQVQLHHTPSCLLVRLKLPFSLVSPVCSMPATHG